MPYMLCEVYRAKMGCHVVRVSLVRTWVVTDRHGAYLRTEGRRTSPLTRPPNGTVEHGVRARGQPFGLRSSRAQHEQGQSFVSRSLANANNMTLTLVSL